MIPPAILVHLRGSAARLARSTSRITRHSSGSSSAAAGTAPAASNSAPRWTSSVASPPSSSSMFGPFPSGQVSACSVHHQYSASVSPFQAKTATPRGSLGVPSGPTATAAAAWSWVEKMLQLAQRTWAPSATSVSMSTAVWTVMCCDPVIRAPASGLVPEYSLRTAISPGISCSASRISLRPNSASARSATLNGTCSAAICAPACRGLVPTIRSPARSAQRPGDVPDERLLEYARADHRSVPAPGDLRPDAPLPRGSRLAPRRPRPASAAEPAPPVRPARPRCGLARPGDRAALRHQPGGARVRAAGARRSGRPRRGRRVRPADRQDPAASGDGDGLREGARAAPARQPARRAGGSRRAAARGRAARDGSGSYFFRRAARTDGSLTSSRVGWYRSGSRKISVAIGTAARIRRSAASIAAAMLAAVSAGRTATFAATSSDAGPMCRVRRWMTRSIPGPASIAATIARCASGLAASPTSRLFISAASTTATAPRSAPIAREPAPSQRPSPVTVVTTSAMTAKASPVSAARSSSSTAGSSGAFACLMNARQLARPRVAFDSLMAVRNENASSPTATPSTTKPTTGDARRSGCAIRWTPSYTENTAPATNSTTATTNAYTYRSAPNPNWCSSVSPRLARLRPMISRTWLPESATEWTDSASSDAEPVTANAANFVAAMPRFAASAASTARGLLAWSGLIARRGRGARLADQQHRDVVADRVRQAASVAGADELLGRVVRPQRRMALGAGEDLQQPVFKLHGTLPRDRLGEVTHPPQDLVSHLSRRRGPARLDVAPQQRLGVGRAHVEPPVPARDRQAVEIVRGDARAGREHLADPRQGGRLVPHLAVDLPGGHVPGVALQQPGERVVLAAEGRQDVQRSQHPRVGVPEVPEVEVAGVLAPEDRAALGHHRLDERVAHAGAHRDPPVLGDDLGNRARGDQIVDDRSPGLAGQLAHGDQRGERRRGDDVPPLVDHEAAIGVPVERQAGVRRRVDHRPPQVLQVRRVDRVGLVMGERAVQLEVERHDLDRQPLEHLRHRMAGHPVARVHGDLERPDPGQVHQPPEAGGVAGEQVPAGDRARPGGLRRDAAGRHLAQLGQAAVLADRARAVPAQLDPVVGRRVVAGGDHGAGDAQAAAGVVEHVGGAEPAVDDVGASRGHPPRERRGERRRRGAHVVDDHDRARPRQRGERRAHGLRDSLVQLLGDVAADVIGLEDLLVVGHSPASSRRLPPAPRGPAPPPPVGRLPGWPGLLPPASLGWRRAQHPQVPPPADLDALPDRLGPGAGPGRARRLPHRVGQGLQVVARRPVAGAERQPHDVPPARRGEPVGVLAAQVVAVRLDERGERPEDRRGVPVHVGQRAHGIPPAGRPRAAARTQRLTSLTPLIPGAGPGRAVARRGPPAAGPRTWLTRADRTGSPAANAITRGTLHDRVSPAGAGGGTRSTVPSRACAGTRHGRPCRPGATSAGPARPLATSAGPYYPG